MPERPSACLRILLVEDHVDTARAMAKLLASDAHVVRCAHSGSEALRAAAAATDGPFDLLICDVHLPDMDGFEVMRQMKSRHGMAGGIAISGRGEAADAERARAAGFTHYLVKPVEWGALKALVVRVAAGEGGDGDASSAAPLA